MVQDRKGGEMVEASGRSASLSAAEAVGRFTVFNIRGNHYRLVTLIYYRAKPSSYGWC